jgi:hypothetical protein
LQHGGPDSASRLFLSLIAINFISSILRGMKHYAEISLCHRLRQ